MNIILDIGNPFIKDGKPEQKADSPSPSQQSDDELKPIPINLQDDSFMQSSVDNVFNTTNKDDAKDVEANAKQRERDADYMMGIIEANDEFNKIHIDTANDDYLKLAWRDIARNKRNRLMDKIKPIAFSVTVIVITCLVVFLLFMNIPSDLKSFVMPQQEQYASQQQEKNQSEGGWQSKGYRDGNNRNNASDKAPGI